MWDVGPQQREPLDTIFTVGPTGTCSASLYSTATTPIALESHDLAYNFFILNSYRPTGSYAGGFTNNVGQDVLSTLAPLCAGDACPCNTFIALILTYI
jgi:hypothetical protein